MPRKRIRLAPDVYSEPGRIFSVTIATRNREKVFADLDFGRECIGVLGAMCDGHLLRGYAYCLMPDHVHLLLGVDEGASLVTEVGRWKSRCSLAAGRRRRDGRIWQRSFYDHALRNDEDVVVVARYIIENPVRANLVERSQDYPLSGSFEYQLW